MSKETFTKEVSDNIYPVAWDQDRINTIILREPAQNRDGEDREYSLSTDLAFTIGLAAVRGYLGNPALFSVNGITNAVTKYDENEHGLKTTSLEKKDQRLSVVCRQSGYARVGEKVLNYYSNVPVDVTTKQVVSELGVSLRKKEEAQPKVEKVKSLACEKFDLISV